MAKIAYQLTTPKVEVPDFFIPLQSRSTDLRSTPDRLVVSNHDLAEYLISISAEEVVGRLPDPIASPEPRRRQRSLAFTNPSTTVYDERITYLIRGWGEEGRKIGRQDDIGKLEIDRTEGTSRIFLATAREDDPFALEHIVERPILKAPRNYSIIDKEDARVTFLEDLGVYGITVTETKVTRNSKNDASIIFRPAIYLTSDFQRYTRKRGTPKTGLWLLTKDWVLFPKKVLDPYEQKAFAALFSTRVGEDDKDTPLKMYHRERPGVWIAYSQDLVHWYDHKEILTPVKAEAKLGPSSQPIDMGNYWLVFIHAVKMEQNAGTGIRYVTQDQVDAMGETEKKAIQRCYTPQAILLDKLNPDKVCYVTEDLRQPEGWEINTDCRLRHHMITSAMKAVLLDGEPVDAIITWHGAGDKHSGASVIRPKNLREVMYKVPEERIPILRS